MAIALVPEAATAAPLPMPSASQAASPPMSPAAVQSEAPFAPPEARRVAHAEMVHGALRVDPYAWLRDRDNPEVAAYLAAENAYTEQMTAGSEALREALYQEMLGRIPERDASVPQYQHGWWYYTRTEPGLAYPLHCRRAGLLDAPEEVYLDQNRLAEGHAFHALAAVEVSPDGTLLVTIEDTTGHRDFTLVVRDLSTGEELERLADVWTGFAWASDSRSFFYMTADAAKRGDAVWHHRIGAPRAEDTLVFREEDVRFDVDLVRTRSGRYALIESDSFSCSEWWALRLDAPEFPPRLFAPRRPGITYSVEHGEDGFYIVTNEGAVDFRVLLAPEDDPDPARWTEWLPARPGVFVESLDVFRDFVVVSERVGGLRQFHVIPRDGTPPHRIAFSEPAYGVLPLGNSDYEARSYRFRYSSPRTPPEIIEYDFATRIRTVRKRHAVPSGFDPDAYEVRRLELPARDGAMVPVSLLARKDTRQDGQNPLLLYAYGAYGVSVEPVFNVAVLSLVDRGFVYAIAHVRGGQELGRRWYEHGKLRHKRNTFTDFIDVAEGLVRAGWTRPDRLVAAGASAGGLLMGVVANERPDLFRAIIADVPFVDVINTMLDPSIPLTAPEWEQWGDPRDPEQYAYLLSYSPYDNVRAQAYPWMLVTTSIHDSQVMYWEPAKWVARLRAMKTDQNPLLFLTAMAGGHTGASDRYERLREFAFRCAFLLEAVGLGSTGANSGRVFHSGTGASHPALGTYGEASART
jgi:oligopeptidase B